MAIASRIEIRRVDHVVPLGIALLAAVQLVTAALIVVAPHWFFDNIGAFGAYNSHYVGDTAAFQAGLGAALAAALVVPSLRCGALAAAMATTGFHALNHWIDVNAAHPGSADGVGDAIALTMLFLLTALLTRDAVRGSRRTAAYEHSA
jgi:hypothetical protein